MHKIKISDQIQQGNIYSQKADHFKPKLVLRDLSKDRYQKANRGSYGQTVPIGCIIDASDKIENQRTPSGVSKLYLNHESILAQGKTYKNILSDNNRNNIIGTHMSEIAMALMDAQVSNNTTGNEMMDNSTTYLSTLLDNQGLLAGLPYEIYTSLVEVDKYRVDFNNMMSYVSAIIKWLGEDNKNNQNSVLKNISESIFNNPKNYLDGFTMNELGVVNSPKVIYDNLTSLTKPSKISDNIVIDKWKYLNTETVLLSNLSSMSAMINQESANGVITESLIAANGNSSVDVRKSIVNSGIDANIVQMEDDKDIVIDPTTGLKTTVEQRTIDELVYLNNIIQGNFSDGDKKNATDRIEKVKHEFMNTKLGGLMNMYNNWNNNGGNGNNGNGNWNNNGGNGNWNNNGGNGNWNGNGGNGNGGNGNWNGNGGNGNGNGNWNNNGGNGNGNWNSNGGNGNGGNGNWNNNGGNGNGNWNSNGGNGNGGNGNGNWNSNGGNGNNGNGNWNNNGGNGNGGNGNWNSNGGNGNGGNGNGGNGNGNWNSNGGNGGNGGNGNGGNGNGNWNSNGGNGNGGNGNGGNGNWDSNNNNNNNNGGGWSGTSGDFM